MPPLRDRAEDLPLLAEHFLEQAKETYGRKGVALTPEARAAIEVYPWPGNVRELRNALERTVVMLEGDLIRPRDMGLPEVAMAIRKITPEEAGLSALSAEIRFQVGTTLHEIELEAIRRTLEFTGGDKAKAAEILGINQRTIYRKLPEL